MLILTPSRFSLANSKCRQQMLLAIGAITSFSRDYRFFRQQTLDKGKSLSLSAEWGDRVWARKAIALSVSISSCTS
ncbi:hypothetical protein LC607_17680 [Nostoc sp. CHAB 5824]|nr:hypothetical protein [Nostoc sp. CHAB 5824]